MPSNEALLKLRELHEKATAPPWDARTRCEEPHVVHVYHDPLGRRCTAFVSLNNSTTLENTANAELIAAARNALPALLDIATVAIEAHAHILELRDAFERGALASHDGRNGLRSNRNADMDVLLRAALNKLKEGDKEL